MNLLTALVFILCLESLNCVFDWVDPIREHCKKEENVGEKDILNWNDINVKCYYHCVFEKEGIIINGTYAGNNRWCKGVQDANKCELARKVLGGSLLKGRG